MIIQNSNLRRMLFKNRYKILGGIFAIILALSLIQAFNRQAYEQVKNRQSKNTIKNANSTGWIPDNETLVLGENISKTNQAIYSNIINQFIEACNQKQIEKAYNMLTPECKQVLYNSKIELFEKNYINRFFASKKSYNIQSWVNGKNPTYQVKITDDILSTGKTSSQTIEEYYTVVKEEDQYQLNINGYIGYEKMNAQTEKNGILIQVKGKHIYREYEEYHIATENHTKDTVLLDSKETTDSIFLYNDNESSFPAQLYKTDELKLTIEPNRKKEIKITFNKRYTTTTKISYMVFKDIILNKQEYKEINNKEEYLNRLSISISI